MSKKGHMVSKNAGYKVTSKRSASKRGTSNIADSRKASHAKGGSGDAGPNAPHRCPKK